MSYLVLARKFRPKTFTEMVGQDHVVRALTNALQTQRLHHAYLFTGTRGVGKTTVSRILAKSLNCIGIDGLGGITAQPCGQCQACLDIDAGRFVDYIELDAASNRGVEEISRLLEQAVYKPVAGRFKVFMIDEVHMLSNTAFNAMLKTLEEPPDYLKFVLATTDPQKVPVTVLSRCLQFNLRPMAPETIYEHLNQVLSTEQIAFDSGGLHMLSRAAHGSMRDALSLTDQAISYGNGTIEEDGVRQMLGAIDRSHVFNLLNALSVGDASAVIELVNFMREQGLAASAALEELVSVLQQIAVAQFAPQAIDTQDPDKDNIQVLAARFAPDEMQLLYSIVLRGQDELGLASDEYAALMMILLRYTAFTGQKKNDENAVTAVSSAHKNTLPIQAASQMQNVIQPRAVELPKAVEAVQTPQIYQAPKAHDESAHDEKIDAVASASVILTPATPPAPVESFDAPAGAIEQTSAEINQEMLPDAKQNDGQQATGILQPDVDPQVVSPTPTPAVEAVPNTHQKVDRIRQENVESYQVGESDDLPPWLDEDTFQQEAVPSAHQDIEVKQENVKETFSSAQKLAPLQPGTPVTDRWFDIVMALEQQGLVIALVRELVMNTQAQEMSDDEKRWLLFCDRQTLLQENNQRKLVQILTDFLDHPVDLTFDFQPTNDTPNLRIKHMEEQKLAQAVLRVETDPDVQHLLKQFPGSKVVPGSIKAL